MTTSLGAVILPRSSYYVEHKLWDEFYRISSKALQFVYIVSLPLTFFFILFATPTIMVLAGNEFVGAVEPMRIIMPTVIVVGMSNILGIQMLLPLGKEKIVLLSTLLGGVADFFLNFILIDKFAASGAALGTLVAEIVVLLVQWVFLKDIIGSFEDKIPIWKILISIIVATISCGWILFLKWRNLYVLITSSLIFGFMYLLSLVILKDNTVLYVIERLKSLQNRLKR